MASAADPISRFSALPALPAFIDRALDVPGASAVAEPFLAELARPERGVLAVVLYGSCLWSELRGPTSHPDFFVVVDSLRAWHTRGWARLLNAVLPPSVFRLRAGPLEAKVSVVSAAQLAQHCSAAAPDLHHLGRFSKRIALVWARDPASRSLVAAAQRAAFETLAPLVRTRFGEVVHADELMRTLIRISYEAEVRVAEHGKADALFEIEREHYRAIGRELLAGLGGVSDGDPLRFRVPPGDAPPERLRRLLRRSRRRAVLRWPAYICTYDGWLDYVMAKLARNGDRVPLTRLERRHPLIFGLPVLFRLARTKRLS